MADDVEIIEDITIILQSGVPGEKGDTGNVGSNGVTGPQGEAATITVGTVTTGEAGTDATVTNIGTSGAAVFDFTIPGSPTITVGTTTTGEAGTEASVTNSGTESAAVLDFVIPRGEDAQGNLTTALNETSVTMASASTMNIGAAAGNYIIVTGTTTITAFDTVQAGARRILRFSGALTITYNASTISLPGQVDLAVNSGDAVEFLSLGSGSWTCIDYQPLSGNFIKDRTNTTAGSISLTYSGSQVINISPDIHGHIEIGDVTGTATAGASTPYIDWHYAMGSQQDYNVRQINSIDGHMIFTGNSSNAMKVCCYGVLSSTRHGFMLGSTGVYGYLDYDTSSSSVRLSGYAPLVFGHNTNAAHNSGTFTEQMRLTTAGRLGLGTTSPAYTLDVTGNINATTGINLTGGSNLYLLGSTTGSSADAGDIIFTDSAGTELTRIAQSGVNIGVGIASPTAKLDVAGDTRIYNTGIGTTLLVGSSATGKTSLLLQTSTDASGYSIIASTSVSGSTVGKLALNPNGGNVGIGTAAPNYPLDVAGIIAYHTDNAYSFGTASYRASTIYAATSTIATSDERAKTDITDSALGLEFVNQLRPVSYKFKVGSNTVTQEEDGTETVVISEEVENEDGSVTPALTEERTKYKEVVTAVAGVRNHYGMIAQEVQAILGDTDFGGYVYDEESDTYGLRYEEFIAPLIKAVQELSATVTTQAETMSTQATTITTMQATLTAMETRLTALEAVV